MSQGRGRDSSRRKRDGSILKNSRERRASAVRERIGPCVIVLYKSPNGHRLHRMRKDSNCRVVDPVAAQNKMNSILCTELRRPPFLPWPTPFRQLLANAAIAASRVGS